MAVGEVVVDKNLVAGAQQFGANYTADVSRASGDQNSHARDSVMVASTQYLVPQYAVPSLPCEGGSGKAIAHR